MTGRKREDHHALTDLDLWREVTRQVRPLSDRRQVAADGPAKQSEATTPSAPQGRPKKKIQTPQPKRETTIKDTPLELSHGTSEGLDRRQDARFRKGRLPIEGRLDLHGLHLSPAQRALDRFLLDAQAQGKRCVLVITGKGRDDRGALRREVPLWLNRPAVRSIVVSFTYAQQKDGGQGALYILLKRRRPKRGAEGQ